MRGWIVVALLCAIGCGKQLNADFCATHPGDERCLAGDAGTRADAPRDADIDAAPLPACPGNYTIMITSQPRSKYLQEDGVDDWNSAVAKCADDLPGHTHLAVINSATELTDLDPYFDRKRFIGISDKLSDGTYRAVTDEPVDYPALYTPAHPPWITGEPNDSGDCVAIDSDLAAWDEDCTGQFIDLAWLCECDDYGDDPDNY